MNRGPPGFKRSSTLVPYTKPCRSGPEQRRRRRPAPACPRNASGATIRRGGCGRPQPSGRPPARSGDRVGGEDRHGGGSRPGRTRRSRPHISTVEMPRGRKGVVWGKDVSGRVGLGGRRIIKKKKK